MTFWRTKKIPKLPSSINHQPQPEQYEFNTPKEHNILAQPYVLVDSDWTGNVKTRWSVSVIIIIMAGAAVLYKAILERIVTLSSTEAEFYALSEEGKLALYVQSILNKLGMSQQIATSIYEDNTKAFYIHDTKSETNKEITTS